MGYGVFFGTNGGDVHALQLPSFYHADPPSAGWENTATPVTGTFKSKEVDLGDWDTLKLIKKMFFAFQGEEVYVTAHFVKADGTKTEIDLALGADDLPESFTGVPSIQTTPNRIRGVAVEVSADDLELTSIDMLWRQIRIKG